jgi:hypothetical protein
LTLSVSKENTTQATKKDKNIKRFQKEFTLI